MHVGLDDQVEWGFSILPDTTTFLHDCKYSNKEGNEDDYLLEAISLDVGKLRLSFFFDCATPRN